MARILVIDDDPSVRALLDAHFSDSGHKVFLAEDGAHGIGLAVSVVPDVVILDLKMPVLDGHSTFRVLQSDPQMADIPVVVLTGENSEHIQAELLDVGCAEYVTKPFDINHLERMVMATVDEGAAPTPFPA